MSVCCGCWRSPSLLRGSIARLALVIVRLMSYRRHNYKAASGSRGGGEPGVFVRWCFLSLAFLSSHLTAILISMRYLPRRIFGVWAKQSIHSFWSKETYLELLLLLLGSTLILDVKLFWERKGRSLSAIPLYNLTTFVVIKPLHALPLKETCFNCCIYIHFFHLDNNNTYSFAKLCTSPDKYLDQKFQINISMKINKFEYLKSEKTHDESCSPSHHWDVEKTRQISLHLVLILN